MRAACRAPASLVDKQPVLCEDCGRSRVARNATFRYGAISHAINNGRLRPLSHLAGGAPGEGRGAEESPAPIPEPPEPESLPLGDWVLVWESRLPCSRALSRVAFAFLLQASFASPTWSSHRAFATSNSASALVSASLNRFFGESRSITLACASAIDFCPSASASHIFFALSRSASHFLIAKSCCCSICRLDRDCVGTRTTCSAHAP